MLREALKIRALSEDAAILAKVASIVRKDIMNHQGFKFSGCFPAQCQEDSLPASLKSLVSMMLNGSSLQDQEKRDSQACLTIGQCIVYNSKKKMSHTALKARHSKEREPPFPIYVGIKFMRLPEMPTNAEPGESQTPITIPPSGDLNHSLPDSYACVPSVALKTTDVVEPQCNVSSVEQCLDATKSKECNWLQHALRLLQKENLTSGDNITWAAYHAAMQPPIVDPPALCTLLPMFYEKAATPAMIKHGMDVIRQDIQFLNPTESRRLRFVYLLLPADRGAEDPGSGVTKRSNKKDHQNDLTSTQQPKREFRKVGLEHHSGTLYQQNRTRIQSHVPSSGLVARIQTSQFADATQMLNAEAN
ncbi:hypothetical protein JTB14_017498 [Gonioctena quinquepunctata]|nr:hypothetical protein JTB14_017498 [Gonioctena quinquepunctata]